MGHGMPARVWFFLGAFFFFFLMNEFLLTTKQSTQHTSAENLLEL
jgi:hypothetical protein